VPRRSAAIAVISAGLAVLAMACGAADAEGPSRADTYQRNNPREGLGAGGADPGAPPRDMPGAGRGSATPRGK
jgi:hypothetical protein